MQKTKNIRIAAALSLSAVNFVLSGSPSFAQTKVDVPTNLEQDVIAPPQCAFPCNEAFVLPAFARRLSLSGPQGAFETKLNRNEFFKKLEDWRQYLEIYRRSIDAKQFKAPDWKAANVTYKIELGKYDQFFESYRNAIAMDQAGHITYGN